MSTPASRRLWAATALVTILLLLVGWFLLLAPQRVNLALLRSQGVELTRENDRLRENVAQLQDQAGELSERRARLADLRVRVPPDAGLPELLRALEAAAQTAGVELVSLTPGSPVPLPLATTRSDTNVGQLQQIPLTVVARGGYVETAAYLDQIENLPRTVLIDSLTVVSERAVTANRPPGEGGRVEATLQGRVFVQPPDPLAAGPSEPTPSPSVVPTAVPSVVPSVVPTVVPTAVPSAAPPAAEASPGPTVPEPPVP